MSRKTIISYQMTVFDCFFSLRFISLRWRPLQKTISRLARLNGVRSNQKYMKTKDPKIYYTYLITCFLFSQTFPLSVFFISTRLILIIFLFCFTLFYNCFTLFYIDYKPVTTTLIQSHGRPKFFFMQLPWFNKISRSLNKILIENFSGFYRA